MSSFSDGIQNGYLDENPSLGRKDKQPKWKGNGLKVILDEERLFVESSKFLSAMIMTRCVNRFWYSILLKRLSR